MVYICTMYSNYRCILHTEPAPEGPGYVGSFEVVDHRGDTVQVGRHDAVYPRMQQALEQVWAMGRNAVAALEAKR
ncbi:MULTISPECIES: hypothetical protein [unclassified Luteibacter]|uniref:hypothetical protein n=1 Tax=Luteibacter sp. PvP019 TaxID=3156436 RepID=UPI003395DC2A